MTEKTYTPEDRIRLFIYLQEKLSELGLRVLGIRHNNVGACVLLLEFGGVQEEMPLGDPRIPQRELQSLLTASPEKAESAKVGDLEKVLALLEILRDEWEDDHLPLYLMRSEATELDLRILEDSLLSSATEDDVMSRLSSVWESTRDPTILWREFRRVCGIHQGSNEPELFDLKREVHRRRMADWIASEYADEPQETESQVETPPRLDAETSDHGPAQGEPTNIFRKVSESVYEIRFGGGEKRPVKSLLGLRHIHTLLKSPNQEVNVDVFLPEPPQVSGLPQAADDGLRSADRLKFNSALDSKAIREVDERLRTLLDVEIPKLCNEAAEFDRDGNSVEQEECLQEIEEMMREVHALEEEKRREKYPEQESNSKRKQDAVRNAIDHSLRRLEQDDVMKPFVEHFRECYSGGTTFCYRPSPDVVWVTL
jgi:hypothetical protein